jgi:hypothetical protein
MMKEYYEIWVGKINALNGEKNNNTKNFVIC